MKGTPFKTLLALAVTSLTLQSASATTIDRQLEAWKAEVEYKRDTIHADFNLFKSRELQKTAFTNGGVVWAQRYTDSWGGWIYTDWDAAKKLHHNTLQSLKKSIKQLDKKESLSEASIHAHQSMMTDFRSQHSQIRKLLHARIKLNVHQGLELDSYNEAFEAYLIANLAGAKKAAAVLKAKANYHKNRADIWSREGSEASALLRQIGRQQIVHVGKFEKAYKHALAKAKSGKLEDTTTASN